MDAFDLKTLSELVGISPRTVHFYVQQGLVPRPGGKGRGSWYTQEHLDRLLLIRKLQAKNLPLGEIRRQVERLSSAEIGQLAAAPPEPRPSSAAEYIREVLGGTLEAFMPIARRAPAAAAWTEMAPLAGLPTAPDSDAPMVASSAIAAPPGVAAPPGLAAPPGTMAPPGATAPGRSHWERISLSPDIELHVRRPLSRTANRKLDQLIEQAAKLFREDV